MMSLSSGLSCCSVLGMSLLSGLSSEYCRVLGMSLSSGLSSVPHFHSARACVRVRTCVCGSLHVHVFLILCLCFCVLRMHVCVYICVCVCVCMRVCVCVCACVWVRCGHLCSDHIIGALECLGFRPETWPVLICVAKCVQCVAECVAFMFQNLDATHSHMCCSVCCSMCCSVLVLICMTCPFYLSYHSFMHVVQQGVIWDTLLWPCMCCSKGVIWPCMCCSIIVQTRCSIIVQTIMLCSCPVDLLRSCRVLLHYYNALHYNALIMLYNNALL